MQSNNEGDGGERAHHFLKAFLEEHDRVCIVLLRSSLVRLVGAVVVHLGQRQSLLKGQLHI